MSIKYLGSALVYADGSVEPLEEGTEVMPPYLNDEVYIVQFSQLDDLLAECEDHAAVVRIEALTLRWPAVNGRRGLVEYGITVRAETDRWEILSWWLPLTVEAGICEPGLKPVAEITLQEGRYCKDRDWIERVRELVWQYVCRKVTVATEVLPGVVDIGDVELLVGARPKEVWKEVLDGD